MNIFPISDLHLDFSQNFIFMREFFLSSQALNDVDTIVIAGDMSQFNYRKRDFFIRKCLFPKFRTIICVPGNHEFYESKHGKDDERLDYMHEVMESEEYPGHVCYTLNNSWVDVDGVRFVCSTLWSPITRCVGAVLRGMNDYHWIKGFTIDQCNEIHLKSQYFLNNALLDCPYDVNPVVVTHHLPLWCLIDEHFKNNALNEAYASNQESLVTMHDDRIAAWIYGHAHRYHEKEICGIPFIRNPLGYMHVEQTSVCLDKRLFVEAGNT